MATTTKGGPDRAVAIELGRLDLDEKCSCRAASPDSAKVQEYVEHLLDGGEFPPVAVTSDGETHWVTDGRIRLAAYRLAGRSHVEALVSPGGFREARRRAAAANPGHGLPRTQADKRKAVWSVLTLLDEEGSVNSWANADVARHCAVSGPLVAGLKAIFLEQKAAARRKQEEAETARAGMVAPPEEEAEGSPEDDFIEVIADPEAPKAEADDDEGDDEGLDEVDRRDLEATRERAYRALRKAARFAAALNLTLEALAVEWRRDPRGKTLAEVEEEGRQVRRHELQAGKDADPASKKRSPWDDD